MRATSETNVVLINPSIGYHYRSGKWERFREGCRKLSLFPGLCLPHLAGIIEDRCDGVRVHLIDENVQDIDTGAVEAAYPPGNTLIGLTGNTLQIYRAYELADHFRARGYRVMMGGIHVSMVEPGEAEKHCDAVVRGEADEIVPRVVNDFRQGRLAPEYRVSEFPCLENLPRPRFELLPLEKYFNVMLLVQTSRGCMHDCDFCSVRKFNGLPRRRPVEDVIEEIRGQIAHPRIARCLKVNRRKSVNVFFVDDHFCANHDRTASLCEGLVRLRDEIGVKIRWCTQVTARTANDRALLKTMSAAGCDMVFVGFESVDPERLKSIRKTQNNAARYLEQIRAFHAEGINVFAAWIVGFEGETREERDRSMRFFRDKAGVQLMAINPLTPFAGTRLFDRMARDGKLMDERYWLSEDIATRLIPVRRLHENGFTDDYWRLNSQFFNVWNLGRIILGGRQFEDWRWYMKTFILFGLNAKFVRGVMSS